MLFTSLGVSVSQIVLFTDISRIREMLDWKQSVAFEVGVDQMLRNIDYWKEAPVWTPDVIATSTAEWFRYPGKD